MMTLITLAKKENRNSLPFLLSLVLFLFGPLTEGYTQKAYLIDEFVKEAGEKNTDYLKNLVYDNVTTIVIKDSNIKMVGEGFPQKVSVDINSIATLKSENDIFRTVKLLQINLGSTSEKSALRINLEDLKSFSNIAYIFINSEIPLTQAEAEMMVTGFEEGDIILLYQVNSNF
ncbi:hypothetical protein [Cognataquiflexum rubidum]|uniref:hypothetical protein n=1 Tax=Cognataquiflexum rubidum TaxID=2922273 RepID=UPI001F1427DB|nr:hypothetical protein [Cognataquiflexum rubidum]MCH6233971.1 hypothetical protein [Cognataquiflexum rubidum]